MFSGIVKEIGAVTTVQAKDDDCSIVVSSTLFSVDVSLGDSISVSGVCLTVAELGANSARFDLATETRRCTNLGELVEGARVNLEPALRAGDRLDGHFVLGHVDCCAKVLEREEEENTVKFVFELPQGIAKYIAPKGSIAVDGVSLTVGEVSENSFSVYVVPHTLKHTTFQDLSPGSVVNLEADCLARYAERILGCSK